MEIGTYVIVRTYLSQLAVDGTRTSLIITAPHAAIAKLTTKEDAIEALKYLINVDSEANESEKKKSA